MKILLLFLDGEEIAQLAFHKSYEGKLVDVLTKMCRFVAHFKYNISFRIKS